MAQDLYRRLGIDFGAQMPVERALAWARENDFAYLDVRLGDAGNEFDSFDADRIRAARRIVDEDGAHLGLHTLSAVNTAETAPFLDAAVDAYLRGYIDLAGPLGAEWIVLHAGYHFTGDYERRREAGLERLQRIGDYAHARGVTVLLENMNPEPAAAEMRYLGCDIDECRYYFGRLDPERVRWSFTVNHAHMLPVGIDGFLAAFDPRRLGEVRLADNRGGKEEHLRPGEGNIDFARMFGLLDAAGYAGHYMLAFGTIDDMRAGRSWLVDRVADAAPSRRS